MLRSLVIGIGVIVSIAIVWILVQHLWKTVFSEEYSAIDALEDRRNCSNCGCTTICKRKNKEII